MKTWFKKNVTVIGLLAAFNEVLRTGCYVITGLWIAEHL
jgi:hypothetical protein